MKFERQNPDKRPKMSDFETLEGQAYLTFLYRDKGMTDAEAAKEIGISRQTIYNWRKRSKAIDDAINKGKAYIDTLVENALLREALKGNIAAIMAWLYNRKRDRWRPIWNYTDSDDKTGEGLKRYLEASKAIPPERITDLFSDEDVQTPEGLEESSQNDAKL